MPDRDPNEHTEKVRRKPLKSISCHYERPHHHVWRGAAQVSLAVVILMAITHSDHKSQYKHVSSTFGGKWRRRKEIDVASPPPPPPHHTHAPYPIPPFPFCPPLKRKCPAVFLDAVNIALNVQLEQKVSYRPVGYSDFSTLRTRSRVVVVKSLHHSCTLLLIFVVVLFCGGQVLQSGLVSSRRRHYLPLMSLRGLRIL